MAVTSQDIADRLGRTLTPVEIRQVNLWIEDARALIQRRSERVGIAPDPLGLDRVIALAVTRHAEHPSAETQVDVAVDDGRVSRRYSRSDGQVTILPEWWDDLGLSLPDVTEWCGSLAYGGGS